MQLKATLLSAATLAANAALILLLTDTAEGLSNQACQDIGQHRSPITVTPVYTGNPETLGHIRIVDMGEPIAEGQTVTVSLRHSTSPLNIDDDAIPSAAAVPKTFKKLRGPTFRGRHSFPIVGEAAILLPPAAEFWSYTIIPAPFYMTQPPVTHIYSEHCSAGLVTYGETPQSI